MDRAAVTVPEVLYRRAAIAANLCARIENLQIPALLLKNARDVQTGSLIDDCFLLRGHLHAGTDRAEVEHGGDNVELRGTQQAVTFRVVRDRADRCQQGHVGQLELAVHVDLVHERIQPLPPAGHLAVVQEHELIVCRGVLAVKAVPVGEQVGCQLLVGHGRQHAGLRLEGRSDAPVRGREVNGRHGAEHESGQSAGQCGQGRALRDGGVRIATHAHHAVILGRLGERAEGGGRIGDDCLRVGIPSDIGVPLVLRVRPDGKQGLVGRHRLPQGHEINPVLGLGLEVVQGGRGSVRNGTLRKGRAGRAGQLEGGRERTRGERHGARRTRGCRCQNKLARHGIPRSGQRRAGKARSNLRGRIAEAGRGRHADRAGRFQRAVDRDDNRTAQGLQVRQGQSRQRTGLQPSRAAAGIHVRGEQHGARFLRGIVVAEEVGLRQGVFVRRRAEEIGHGVRAGEGRHGSGRHQNILGEDDAVKRQRIPASAHNAGIYLDNVRSGNAHSLPHRSEGVTDKASVSAKSCGTVTTGLYCMDAVSVHRLSYCCSPVISGD